MYFYKLDNDYIMKMHIYNYVFCMFCDKILLMVKNMKKNETIHETIIHQDVVTKVEKEMLKENEFYDLALLFKMFADETRLKIIKALSVSEMCVYDLAALLNVSQSATSHQLASLKKTRLVRSRKQGKVVYYSLNDEHILNLFNIAYDHICE